MLSTYQVVKYDIEPTILYIISIHIYVYTNNLKNLFIYIYTIQAAQRVLATKGKGRGMRGGSNKKKFGRRNKKQPRHMKGSKTSPTVREEERWDDITGAYGNLPGVEPVRATRGGGSSQMLQQQEQEQQMQQQQEQEQQMQMQQQQQQSTVEENMIVNDNENKLTNNDNNAEGKEQQEAVDLDSLVNADSQPVKDMITPRRGGEEKDGSDEVDEGKKE